MVVEIIFLYITLRSLCFSIFNMVFFPSGPKRDDSSNSLFRIHGHNFNHLLTVYFHYFFLCLLLVHKENIFINQGGLKKND